MKYRPFIQTNSSGLWFPIAGILFFLFASEGLGINSPQGIQAIRIRGSATGTLNQLGRVIDVRYKYMEDQKPPIFTFNQGTIGPIEFERPEDAIGFEILAKIPYAFSTSARIAIELTVQLIAEEESPQTEEYLEIRADGSEQTFEFKMSIHGFVHAGGLDDDAPCLTIVMDGQVLPENVFQPASDSRQFIVEPGHVYQFQVPEGSNIMIQFKRQSN